jgi:ABC-2 type transport system ATP-binding protein
MKRRLTIAAALIHRPEVLFLDEPTTGLDVPSARSLRETVRRVVRDGTTVFLTTHNLTEAETLADDAAILIRGRIVARGTVSELRGRVGEARSLSVRFSSEVAPEKIRESCPSARKVAREGEGFCLEVPALHPAILELADFARREGLRIEELVGAPPSLEDAFLDLLGAQERGREGEP